MRSLADALKAIQAGRGKRRVYVVVGKVVLLVALGIVMVVLKGHRWASASPRLSSVAVMVFLLVWIGFLIAGTRRAAINEALEIVKDKRLCRKCLYPLLEGNPTCPECGLEDARIETRR